MVKGHSDPPAVTDGITSPFLPALQHPLPRRSPTSQPVTFQKLAVYLAFSFLQPGQPSFSELAGEVKFS